MSKFLNIFNLLAVILFLVSLTTALDKTKGEHYLLEWAVQIPGGLDRANIVAEEHGLINRGSILEGEDYYLFAHKDSKSHKSDTPDLEFHQKLNDHPHVHWFEQQVHKSRQKRRNVLEDEL